MTMNKLEPKMIKKTITGKSVNSIESQARSLYSSYIKSIKREIIKEHSNKKDAFSKLIILYVKKINSYDQVINKNFNYFYHDFMCIKVLQLVYITWKNKKQNEARYFYKELSEITVLPGVFSPKYASDSYLWAKYMVDKGLVKNKRILEMGAGTGIISLYLHIYGKPKSVVAADVNEQAVKNIKLNQHLLGLSKEYFSTLKSNLYSHIPKTEKFDVIFWAFVWLALDTKEMETVFKNETNPHVKRLLNSIIDPDYRMLKRFLVESKTKLNSRGKIFLITTDFLNNDYIKSIADEVGYSFKISRFTKNTDVVKGVNMNIDLYQITLEQVK